jgi:TPR repeat protein
MLVKHALLMSMIAAGVSLAIGCAHTSRVNNMIPMNDSLRFASKEDQQRAERSALAGDAEAAKRLAEFYYFVVHDEKQARYWLRKAASFGDKSAKKSLMTLDNL